MHEAIAVISVGKVPIGTKIFIKDNFDSDLIIDATDEQSYKLSDKMGWRLRVRIPENWSSLRAPAPGKFGIAYFEKQDIIKG